MEIFSINQFPLLQLNTMNISLDLNILTESFTKWDEYNKATIPALGTSIPIGHWDEAMPMV